MIQRHGEMCQANTNLTQGPGLVWPKPALRALGSLLFVGVHRACFAGVRVVVALAAVVVKKGAVGRGALVWLNVGAIAAKVAVDGLVGHGLTGGEQRQQQEDGFHGVSFGLVWMQGLFLTWVETNRFWKCEGWHADLVKINFLKAWMPAFAGMTGPPPGCCPPNAPR